MAEVEINAGQSPSVLMPELGQGDYRYRDPIIDLTVEVKDRMATQAHKLSEHEGKIAGLATTVSALISFKGFLQAAIIGVGSLLVAGMALLFVNVNSMDGRTQEKLAGTNERLTSLESKVDTLAGKVDALPGRIDETLRTTSRDLVLIAQGVRRPTGETEELPR